MSDTTPPMPPTTGESTDVADDVEPEVPEEAAVEVEAPPAPESRFRTDKTVDELAQEVLDGKWGNTHDRHLALAQADYDHVAVQKAVEALIKYQQR